MYILAISTQLAEINFVFQIEYNADFEECYIHKALYFSHYLNAKFRILHVMQRQFE